MQGDTDLTNYTRSGVDVDKTVLHEDSIAGLYENQRSALKRNIWEANTAWNVSGQAMRACASHLFEIKKNVPHGNWTSVVENDLHFPPSVATDLISAHQWLDSSKIPNRFLANISARTLATIARLKDSKLRADITEAIVSKEGMGFSEVELKKLVDKAKGKDKKKDAKAVEAKAKRELKADATKEEAISFYKTEINALSSKLSTADTVNKEAKKKNDALNKANKELREANAKLKKDSISGAKNKELYAMVNENPEAASAVMNALSLAKAKQAEMLAKAEQTVASLKS